jgi:hypothetical protein
MRARSQTNAPSVEPAFVALRDLFTGPLAQVTFPGVDAAAVGASVDELHRRAAAIDAARDALAAAERDLAAAEQAFHAQRASSLEQGQLAIAYARVYAKSDPALLASIDRVALPRSRSVTAAATRGGAATHGGAATTESAAAPRRRGRSPKTAAASDDRVAAE